MTEEIEYCLPLLQFGQTTSLPQISRPLPVALAPRLEVLHHRLERVVPRTRRRAVKHAVGVVLVHIVADGGEDVDGARVLLEEARDLAVPVKVVRHLPPDDVGARVEDRLGGVDGQALPERDRVAADGVDDHRERHGG